MTELKDRINDIGTKRNHETNANRILNRNFREGSKVFVRVRQRRKLDNLFEGPFEIKKLSRNPNQVQIDLGNKLRRLNIKELKLFREGSREEAG